MSDKLSTRLLNQMNNELSSIDDTEDGEEFNSIDFIEVRSEWIMGFRKNSILLWTLEEEYLYYKNAYNNTKKVTACTCIDQNCKARIFVREDGTAYRLSSSSHIPHGTFYEKYRHMYCFNRMKEMAISAPASSTPYEIFTEAVLEWQTDPLCRGTKYPQEFAEVKRTLEDCRKKKYGKAPMNGEEILLEFQKENVFEDLGKSKHRERGIFFNEVQISNEYTNCIFSSSKSISLILDNVRQEDRFFLMDGTFRITPRGIFQQVLIIHVQFGIKVKFSFLTTIPSFLKLISLLFLFK